MPSLIREDLTKPGSHALVVGVSRYLHFADGSDPTSAGASFQMEQLSAAARSASEFAVWLLKDYCCPRAPLQSLRVLLSPSENEQIAPDIADLMAGDSSASLANVRTALQEFRRACGSHLDNVAIVYAAGHGAQLTRHGAILLLTDLGANGQMSLLEGAVDMTGVHAGMNHAQTARTQFWFVDACRQVPSVARRFESLTGALKLDVRRGATADASPMFLAATTGKPAYARPNGFTLFNEALMWSLRGGAAVGPEDRGVTAWHVSVSALIHRLPARVKALALAEGAEQSIDVAGKPLEATLHEFATVPKADLHVALLPQEAQVGARATLQQDGTTVFEGANDWPVRRQVDAGLYRLNVAAAAPYVSRERIIDVKPPEKDLNVDVNP